MATTSSGSHTMSKGDSGESSTSTPRQEVTIPGHKVASNWLALVSEQNCSWNCASTEPRSFRFADRHLQEAPFEHSAPAAGTPDYRPASWPASRFAAHQAIDFTARRRLCDRRLGASPSRAGACRSPPNGPALLGARRWREKLLVRPGKGNAESGPDCSPCRGLPPVCPALAGPAPAPFPVPGRCPSSRNRRSLASQRSARLLTACAIARSAFAINPHRGRSAAVSN
jgi:hypothetical protein